MSLTDNKICFFVHKTVALEIELIKNVVKFYNYQFLKKAFS